ncbi:transcriptional regulator [Vagococcus elongatus]|uniref:Transcriptional regulator n=1 Tax=Vagococcus elongatus TaxID=180344 RepID=A0A430B4L6_9ENTE|nr:transcriptional regulator [Vagococcus elongatus]
MKVSRLGIVVWLRLLRFVNHSNSLSNEYLAKYNLSIAKFDVLNQIFVAGALTQRELAEKLMITQGGISRMLARLEKDGYIQRKIDWKTKTITLTDAGEELMRVVQPKQEAFLSSIFEEALNKEELKEFSRLLNKVYKVGLKKEIREEG